MSLSPDNILDKLNKWINANDSEMTFCLFSGGESSIYSQAPFDLEATIPGVFNVYYTNKEKQKRSVECLLHMRNGNTHKIIQPLITDIQ